MTERKAARRSGRTGRRPGKSTTREEILVAARSVFGRLGYERATIRGIAAEASVDAALVLRYYDSKEELFRRAVDWPFDPSEVIALLTAGPRDDIGGRLARFVVSVWEDDDSVERIAALVRAAGSNEDASRILGEFLAHGIIGPLADALGVETERLRIALVSAQFIGIVFARHILAAGPLADATADELVAALTPELQQLLAPDAVAEGLGS